MTTQDALKQIRDLLERIAYDGDIDNEAMAIKALALITDLEVRMGGVPEMNLDKWLQILQDAKAYRATRQPVGDAIQTTPVCNHSEKDVNKPTVTEVNEKRIDVRCPHCKYPHSVACPAQFAVTTSQPTVTEEDVDKLANVMANGWDYGTHPRDKALIVLKALNIKVEG